MEERKKIKKINKLDALTETILSTAIIRILPREIILIISDYAREYSFIKEFLYKVKHQNLIKTYVNTMKHLRTTHFSGSCELGIKGVGNHSRRVFNTEYLYKRYKADDDYNGYEVLLLRTYFGGIAYLQPNRDEKYVCNWNYWLNKYSYFFNFITDKNSYKSIWDTIDQDMKSIKSKTKKGQFPWDRKDEDEDE